MPPKTAHLLPPIRRIRYPSRFVFFDSESTVRHFGEYAPDAEHEEKPHTPRLIVAELWRADPASWTYTQEGETRVFSGSASGLCDDFWGWLSDTAGGSSADRSSVVAIGHNVGYDIQATGGAPRLFAHGWLPDAPYAKGPVFIWRFAKSRRQISLLSSTNFYAVPLRKLGETFGVAKLDTDTQTDDLEELTTYCKRDVEIARLAMLSLVRFLYEGEALHGNPYGPWGDTISSIAFKAFRCSFLRHKIALHVNTTAEEIEREAYSGGRTEAFCVGVNVPVPVYDVDFNSLYASVMIDNPFPIALDRVKQGGVSELYDDLRSNRLVIARVRLRASVPAFPVKGDKLLFPVGEFDTTLCGPELALAFSLGAVRSVDTWVTYRGAAIFNEYVSTFYGLRLEAAEAKRSAIVQLCKNLLNNLYGKFGQRRENWVRVGDAPPFAIGTEEFIGPDGVAFTERTFGGGRWVAETPQEAYNSFPAIAAFVTSYARVKLWGAMNVAGNYDPSIESGAAGREFYYCDTDSLMVSQRGYERLCAADMVSTHGLGKMKLERTAIGQARFNGAKNYLLDETVKRKGVPASARDTWADGSRVVAKDGSPAVVYDSWPRLLSALTAGNLLGFANRQVVKRTSVDYDKAEVGPDGWVRPWRYPRAMDTTCPETLI